MTLGRSLGLAVLASVVASDAADAQHLATLEWQMQPYCNVVTLSISQSAGVYRLDGTDDQCSDTAAAAVGVARRNPNGSIGLGLSIVTTPGGTPVHVDATLGLPSLSGTWRDSAGRSGALVPTTSGGTGGSPRPGPGVAGALAVDATQIQRRIADGCPNGRLMAGVGQEGTVSCTAGGAGDITGLRAGPGLTPGADGETLSLRANNLTAPQGFFADAPLGQPGLLPTIAMGRHFMWYPGDASLRVGETGNLSDGVISPQSVAMGRDVAAAGRASVALGRDAYAIGEASMALGVGTRAGGIGSLAIGSIYDPITRHAEANGAASLAVGRDVRAGGATSIALGARTETATDAIGAFVFGDDSASPAHPMVGFANQFNARAFSRVQFYSNAAATIGVHTGGPTPGWQSVSDARLKAHFRELSGEDVLARLSRLAIREWSYKTQDASIRHVGPTAQDFHAAFGLGETSRQISTVDADGIALASLKAIEARTRTIAKAHRRRQREDDALRARIEDLERRVERRSKQRRSGPDAGAPPALANVTPQR